MRFLSQRLVSVDLVDFWGFSRPVQNPSRTRDFIKIHGIFSGFEARGLFWKISEASATVQTFSRTRDSIKIHVILSDFEAQGVFW